MTDIAQQRFNQSQNVNTRHSREMRLTDNASRNGDREIIAPEVNIFITEDNNSSPTVRSDREYSVIAVR